MNEKIWIIGCNTAGTSAAIWGRKINRHAEINIIDKEKYTEYSRCGLPYAISGEIPSFDNLVLHTVSWYTKILKANVYLTSEVKKINIRNQTIVFENTQSKEVREEPYDKLIIATGSIPKVPPIKGVLDTKGVFFLKTMDDARKIKETATAAKHVTIIGAGLIGVELAEAFHALGLNITIIEFLPSVLPIMIDPDMSRVLYTKMEEEKIKVILNTAAKEVFNDNDKVKIIAEHRETGEVYEIESDLVIVSTGMAPNVSLAKDAGIELGALGGIKVNEKMETNVDNIYAAGDCVETTNLITKKPFISGLGTIAARQGRVAGMNAMGGDVSFPGAIAARVTKLFGYEIAATGLTSYDAERNGIDIISARIKGYDREEYYPDKQQNIVKLIVNKGTQKLIGGQIIGRGASHRINILTATIMHNLSLDDIINLETNYAPPIAPVWDPVAIAAMTVKSKLERKK